MTVTPYKKIFSSYQRYKTLTFKLNLLLWVWEQVRLKKFLSQLVIKPMLYKCEASAWNVLYPLSLLTYLLPSYVEMVPVYQNLLAHFQCHTLVRGQEMKQVLSSLAFNANIILKNIIQAIKWLSLIIFRRYISYSSLEP